MRRGGGRGVTDGVKSILAVAMGFVAACSDAGEVTEETEDAGGGVRAGQEVSVQGVLRHFPQDVKSVQAWYGHEYMVDETPILPTAAVPAARLRQMVGKTVAIEGVWNPGRVVGPEVGEPPQSKPQLAENEPVVRGSGIEASAIAGAGERPAAAR